MKKLAYGLFIFIAIVFVLWIGKPILIPVVWALLAWFLLRGIRQSLTKIDWIKNKIPAKIVSIFSLVLFISVYFLLMEIVLSNIQFLIKKIPEYGTNFNSLVSVLRDTYRADPSILGIGEVNSSQLISILDRLANFLTGFMSNLFMIILYVIFIFSEESNFEAKMNNIFSQGPERTRYFKILNEVGKSISSYLWLKTLVSLCTAIVSWGILIVIGVDAAVFWAFLIFIFNFIPNIGSLIATIFPTLMAIIQFNDFLHPVLVLSLIGLTQLIVGNYLDPKIMGKSLNLSAFVVIVALSFWTILWGITGAVLSVPIMVVLMILFKNIKTTLPIAKAISESGNLD